MSVFSLTDAQLNDVLERSPRWPGGRGSWRNCPAA